MEFLIEHFSVKRDEETDKHGLTLFPEAARRMICWYPYWMSLRSECYGDCWDVDPSRLKIMRDEATA